MAKKTFYSGIDSLLTPSAPKPEPIIPESPHAEPIVEKISNVNPRSSAKKKTPATSSDELVSIIIRVPVDLKIKLDMYCAQNRISKQNFIVNFLKKKLG